MRSGGSVLEAPPSAAEGALPAAEAVTRSGGSVLKAPQRRRGGTPPRSETAKLCVPSTRASCTADTKIPVSAPKREKIRGS